MRCKESEGWGFFRSLLFIFEPGLSQTGPAEVSTIPFQVRARRGGPPLPSPPYPSFGGTCHWGHVSYPLLVDPDSRGLLSDPTGE